MLIRRWAARAPMFRCAVFAGLSLLAYSPFLQLPLISDDYIQIHLGRTYGPVAHWGELAQDALYRCRATSILLTHWTDSLVGTGTVVLSVSSLTLHFVNTILVFLFGFWPRIGWKISFAAACFFAVYQRPQEAVIWYAAMPELLVFGFVMGGLLCWLRYLEGLSRAWYFAALACYLLALLSKESAVVFAPLAALLALLERRKVMVTAPFFVLAVAYYAAAHAARDQHLHFNDGTFSLTAPFVLTAARSIGRMFWGFGAVAIGLTLWLRRGMAIPWIVGAIGWMFVALLPYSFLMYQGTVPSRHTYLASVGVAVLVGRAFILLQERTAGRPLVLAGVVAMCASYQVSYLWLYKFPQYEERAKPTETLIQAVREYQGPVRLTCFPYSVEVAERVLEISTQGEVWIQPASETAPDDLPQINACGERKN